MRDRLGGGALPLGKVFPISGGTNQKSESQCMWKGCHRTAVREIARSNTPRPQDGFSVWWCMCARHFEQSQGLRREQLARLLDSIRLRRTMGSVEFVEL